MRENEGLSLLGNKNVKYDTDYNPGLLETFENKHPENDYWVKFRNHGDFHEGCVNKIMKDLIRLMDPKYIEVRGRFLPRGGISIDPWCNYGKPGTKWEKIAENRMMWFDMNPEAVDNR